MQRIGRLSWAQIIALSAPAMLFAGFQIPMSVYAPAFLAEHVGLSLASIGTIMLIGRLWDMINDPILGLLSDATHTPIGRRRPWILAGAPIAMLGTWQIYFADTGSTFGEILIWMIVLYTGWTMFIVAHGAWGVEISDNYDERSRIFGFKMLAVAAALPLFAIGPAILERTTSATLADQMQLMGWIVIVGMPLAIAWLLWITPEPECAPSKLSWAALGESYFVVFKRPAFALISAAYFFVGMSDAIGSTVYLFFVRDGLGLPDWAATFLVVQALFGFLSIPLWYWISRKTNKRVALIGVLTIQVVLAPVPLFLPAGDLSAFAAYTAVKGMIWGAEYMLLRSIVSDLVDVDASRSGENRAGVFYASFNLTMGLAGAIGSAGLLWGLAHIGFDPRAVATERVSFAPQLRAFAAFAPLVCALLGLILVFAFRMRREDLPQTAPLPAASLPA